MKICPACQTKYSDDTQQFCFQDGTQLNFISQADIPTVVLNESETVTALGQKQQPSARQQAPLEPQRTGSKMAVAIAATVLAMLLLFAAGIGAWLYFKSAQTETAKNTTNKDDVNRSSNANARTNTTQTSPSASPSPTPNASSSVPATNVDEAEEREAVVQTLSSWKASAESLDLDGHMEHYADNVDYYNRDRASAAFVRADKLRAFERYDSINIKLNNISVSLDRTGKEATATMDKEWHFEGEKNSSGKVRQLIKLRNISGEWFITAEKDLKIYYAQ